MRHLPECLTAHGAKQKDKGGNQGREGIQDKRGVMNLRKETLTSALSEEVSHSVEVKAQRESHGLVKRVGLTGTEHIRSIHSEDAHVEASTHGEVLTITLVGSLVMISATQHEAVIVGIFASHAPLYLLHLLLESIGGVIETLEDTRYGRHVIIVLLHTVSVIIVRLAVLGILLGICGYEQFVGIHSHAELVILVEGDSHVQSQTQIGGDKLCIVISAIGNLTADIVDIQSPGETAFAAAHHKIT